MRRELNRQGIEKELIHHPDAGSQYTSFAFTTHLVAAGVDASLGSVGDALDNALMESTIGLYKTELINRRGPWRTLIDVELATAEWVDWYKHQPHPPHHQRSTTSRVRIDVLHSTPAPRSG